MNTKSYLSKFKFILPMICIILIGNCHNSQNTRYGHLLIVGGGFERTPDIMKKFVDLAGGTKARIAIITMASEDYLSAGEYYMMEFKALGAQQAKPFYIRDRSAANSDSVVASLEDFTSFFFGGGDQNRLTKIFLYSEALKVMHRKYHSGSVLGGTSAGAAIMSKIMLNGEGNWTILKKDSVNYAEGFGFITGAIIDQHFVERQRFTRLLAACIEQQLTGIGIDRETAIWVKPNREIEVFGKGVVTVIRTEQADFPPVTPEGVLSARNLSLDIYRAGDRFLY